MIHIYLFFLQMHSNVAIYQIHFLETKSRAILYSKGSFLLIELI